MPLDFPVLLVTAVFASQILVCSFLSAWRFAHATRLMQQNYPPQEYPRLYPIPADQMSRQAALRNTARIAIGIAAALVLAVGLARGIGAARLAQYMMWAAMAQLLPLLLALPLHIRMSRAMRAMPAPSVRSADLRSWKAVEFVAPAEIALGITASCVALACTLYFCLRGAQLSFALVLSAAINGLLLLRMLHVLVGPTIMRRPDPYMSDDDLYRARRFRMLMLFRMAILMGVYFSFILVWASGLLKVDSIYIAAGISVLVQLASLFFTHRMLRAVTDRDVTPYRADAVQKAG